jgi:hypothetical protein
MKSVDNRSISEHLVASFEGKNSLRERNKTEDDNADKIAR